MILEHNAKSSATVLKSSEALSDEFQEINEENEKNTSEANEKEINFSLLFIDKKDYHGIILDDTIKIKVISLILSGQIILIDNL
ncbi:hypothetical protein GLOIN_2v1469587 [Rhizophagus clarus]|uniref:Uncharacterized protein n=1 Tax=Rhizophagus clarus TaxID=94130 RepID=A0A8H3M686_9GLOM|nr:hypothetical protein GLOIN_2v1469587 [Rhizophagus clarus]